MSTRYPGGLITKSPVVPTTSSAPGIWTMEQALQYIKAGTWPLVPVADPYFEYVTMLLPGNGTNGGQNNTFLDSSTNNFTITRNGNTTQGTFSPYGSNWSNYFDGTGDYLTTANSNVNNFGSSDWTMEFWINSTQTTRTDPLGWNYDYTSAGWAGLILNVSASGQMSWYEGTSQRINATSTGWNNGAWNHIAISRSGNSVRMFLNGTQQGSTYTTSLSYGANSTGFIVGVNYDGSGPLNGYISNLRIVKGTAVYTSAFTPPTAPLSAITNTSLLTCQSNRFIDNSTNAFTITRNGNVSVQRFSPFSPTAAYSSSTIGGSGYFDGSGDYLTAASNTAFNLTSGAYTIELFVYFTSSPSVVILLGFQGTASGTGYPHILLSSGTLYWQVRGGGSFDMSASWTPQLNAWHHVVVGFNGSSSAAMWINGSRVATAGGNTFNAQNGVNIGGAADGYVVTGYLSSARIVKGTDVYGVGNTSITVPTAPLTAITNTSLLTNFTNASIIDNAMMNDLETVGNAQISTSVSKFGGGSMAFDGNADYLAKPVDPQNLFGTGDFTVECWVYPTTLNSYNMIFGYWNAAVGNPSNQYWSLRNTGYVHFYDGSTVYEATTGAVSTNQWTHIAISRSGSTLRQFVNGTQVLSSTCSTSLGYASGANIWFGGSAAYLTQHFFTGYIDDLRITKGYARYTSNFTPPTAALPTF